MDRITIDGKEYGKIPFDLERWQNGDFVKVVTRDNKEVEQLTHFSSAKSEISLVSVVLGSINMYYESGKYFETEENSRDLHLIIELPQPKEYWQNVYTYEDIPTIKRVGSDFESQSDADECAYNKLDRIGYFKTTIIEGEQLKYEFIPINQ